MVKVWNKDGSLIYTSEPMDKEESEENSSHLDIVLAGTTFAHLDDADQAVATSVRQNALLEVYSPIRFPGDTSVHGALEVYMYYAPTAQHILDMRRWVLIATSMGFLLLYGGLVSIVWRGSSTTNCTPIIR